MNTDYSLILYSLKSGKSPFTSLLIQTSLWKKHNDMSLANLTHLPHPMKSDLFLENLMLMSDLS